MAVGSIVKRACPLSEQIRHLWPELLSQAPFIKAMAKHMDLTESYGDMQIRIFTELLAHLGDGPYMGELDQPTILYFAIFPQLVWGYMFGLEDNLTAARHPVVKEWLKRAARDLPGNPTLVADDMQINSLVEALAQQLGQTYKWPINK